MKAKNIIVATVVSLTICLATTALGGDGKVVVGSPNKMDLNIFYNYNEADMDSFKNAFTEASRLMFNSTNGQMQFGTIRVSKDNAFEDRADFWVLSGEGGAVSGGIGVLGASGVHVTIYREQHRFTAQDGPDGDERGQFGIVHELGHHAFSLYDEYGKPSTGYPDAPCVNGYCVSEDSLVCCIMDGGTSVHPTHHRTEWCTNPDDGLSTSHITDPMNHQEHMHAEACWQTIASYCSSEYGAAMTEPAVVNTADPAGHVNPAWIVIGDQLRYVICVDKSFSMNGSKIDKAKHGANLFVDLGHEGTGERIAVTSFSGGAGYDPPADVDFTLTEVVTDAVKDDARDAIELIEVENMTAIGDGMRVSLDELETLAQNDACVEAVILLSDGEHNYGAEHPDDVIPDLRDRGARVFTIGLGSAPILDEDLLQHIADETGGLYTHASNEAELAAIYTAYCAEIRGAEVCGEDAGELTPEKYEYREVYVDEFTKEASFVLHWPTGKGALDLKLETPDGKIIDPTTPTTNPDVKYVQMDYYEFYRVRKPMKGTWKLFIYWRTGPSRVPFGAQTLAEAPGVDFSVFIKNHLFKYPQVPIVQASLSAGPHVAGAKVEGVVARPSAEPGGLGDTVPLILYDDGQHIHGDEMADDGIYSNRFLSFSYNGSYQFRFTATNESGKEATPDERMNEEWTPKPIPPFRRVAKNTVIIRGLPQTFIRPNITRVDPAEGNQGQTLNVTVSGSNFVDGAVAELLGGGIVIHNAIVVDQYKIIANITVDPAASLGARDAKVTNPGGLSDYAKGIFTVKKEPDCFPNTPAYAIQYADWLMYGKPRCWCNSRVLGEDISDTGPANYTAGDYQCDGDANTDRENPLAKWRVSASDLSLVIANWKKPIATANPCADIKHDSENPLAKWRVSASDLSRLITNWKKNRTQLAGNCPRTDALR